MWRLRQQLATALQYGLERLRYVEGWEWAIYLALLLALVWATCDALRDSLGSGERSEPPAEGALGDAATTSQAHDAPIAEVQIMDMFSGATMVSNPKETHDYDGELASGTHCFLHKRWDDSASADGEDYFCGKKRLWEVRFQVRFKQRVAASSLRIGVAPFERLPLGKKQVAVQRWLVNTSLSGLRGLYNSPGDDPSGRNPADVEPPITSVPLLEVDQYIPPPEASGVHLLDPAFNTHGMIKKKSKEVKKILSNLVFEPGEVHTFAFWAPSQAFDLARWQTGRTMPFMAGMSLDFLNGPPPMFLSVYVLKPGVGRETRHLESRMVNVLKVAGWSSQYKPTPERMRRLREMATSRKRGSADADGSLSSPLTSTKLSPIEGCMPPCTAGIHRFIRRCFA